MTMACVGLLQLCRALAARSSPTHSATWFHATELLDGLNVGVAATRVTVSKPLRTRPNTTFSPSRDGTGAGPVVMRNSVCAEERSAPTASPSPVAAPSANDTVPGRRCRSRRRAVEELGIGRRSPRLHLTHAIAPSLAGEDVRAGFDPMEDGAGVAFAGRGVDEREETLDDVGDELAVQADHHAAQILGILAQTSLAAEGAVGADDGRAETDVQVHAVRDDGLVQRRERGDAGGARRDAREERARARLPRRRPSRWEGAPPRRRPESRVSRRSSPGCSRVDTREGAAAGRGDAHARHTVAMGCSADHPTVGLSDPRCRVSQISRREKRASVLSSREIPLPRHWSLESLRPRSPQREARHVESDAAEHIANASSGASIFCTSFSLASTCVASSRSAGTSGERSYRRPGSRGKARRKAGEGFA